MKKTLVAFGATIAYIWAAAFVWNSFSEPVFSFNNPWGYPIFITTVILGLALLFVIAFWQEKR